MSTTWPEQLHERTLEVLTLRREVTSLTARVAELDAQNASMFQSAMRDRNAIADLIVKLTAATDEIAMTQQELDDLDVWKERATTAESALRDAREEIVMAPCDATPNSDGDAACGSLKEPNRHGHGPCDCWKRDVLRIIDAALSAAPHPEAPQATTLTLPSMDAMPARIQPSTDLREQTISFAYGNVSIHNLAVTREMCVAEYGKLHPPAPQKCPRCGGSGTVNRCSTGGMLYPVACPDCHGTGWKVQNGK